MNRNHLRVAALAVFLYLSVAPTSFAKPLRDRDVIAEPRDQIVRIIKKVRNFFRGITTQEDFPNPPNP